MQFQGDRKNSQPVHLHHVSLNPKHSFILGFSKGGTVINQLVTEFRFSDVRLTGNTPCCTEEQSRGGQHFNFSEESKIIPNTEQNLLNSIIEIHYLDVGLNSSGAYLTDHEVIERISYCLIQGAQGIQFLLHGTPWQWCHSRRVSSCHEKDQLVHMLESEAQRSGGKLEVCEISYFSDRPPSMQMHFEIIERFDFS